MRLTVLLAPLMLATAQAAPLAAHHAAYVLSLNTAHEQNVTEAHGTMSYDVVDTCSAWTTAQHLVIDLTNKDGQEVHMVSDYATIESKDGTHLDFHSKQVTDQAVTAQLDGTAVLEHSGGRGHADFTAPEKKQVLLPEGTLLPMAHTGALLDAAIAGKKFLSVPLFDAFFDRGSAAETPDYEIGMLYFANGVADNLAMDFSDFAMDGKLETLDMHPAHC